MGIVGKAGAIIAAGTLALYVVLFLVVLPVMAKAPPGMTSAMARGVYAVLYRPLRDSLSTTNAIRLVWQDYEAYWCAGSAGCEL
jgi:hypothetical protein